jgi:hypothetical protein
MAIRGCKGMSMGVTVCQHFCEDVVYVMVETILELEVVQSGCSWRVTLII